LIHKSDAVTLIHKFGAMLLWYINLVLCYFGT